MDDRDTQRVKIPTTLDEQVAILSSRGVIFDDVEFAKDTLNRIGYYRLTAYGLSLRREKDAYLAGTTFSDLLSLYEFDMKLRTLLLALSEPIEISVRARVAYLLAHKYGALGYRNAENFSSTEAHAKFISKIDGQMQVTNEPFISHHRDKYGGQLPVWVAFEVLTFGMLSSLYRNLKTEDKKEYADAHHSAKYYSKLASWLHAMSALRNRCAHYNRIYNRNLTVSPSLPNDASVFEIDPNTLFAVLFIAKKMAEPGSWLSWVTNLQALTEEYQPDLALLGFKPDWALILRQ